MSTKKPVPTLPHFNVMKQFGFLCFCCCLICNQVFADSYYLPIIGAASDGVVLDSQHQQQSLHQLMTKKIVLLSFIYTTCSDVNGCPLATLTLQKLSKQLRQQPALANKLRLLTLSFNPQDTPETMRHYAEHLAQQGLDWRFLSANSEPQLQTLLSHYQQTVEKVYDDNGKFTGTYAHLLRVFLIDSDKNIRNIYNVDSLNVAHIIDDINSLLSKPESLAISKTDEVLHRPGDDKRDYQYSQYQTHSLALSQRQGQAVDLINYVKKPPLGLPKPPYPVDNAISRAKIALGRKLFYDRRLSFNNTFSCANCHIPEQGFTSNEMATAIGVEGRSIRRNTPSLYNVGYAQLLFHDGRENSLEQQVWGPLLAHNEMANPAIATVIDKIKQLADYRDLFAQAFKRSVSMETLGQALASYQRSLNSADSAFDRWYYAKQANALSNQAQRGFKLFTGKAGCKQCHSINRKYALFTDQKRHNTGIGYQASQNNTNEKQAVQLAPGVFVDIDKQQLKSVSETKSNDIGYYEISENPKDRWSYKTPSLRNIALSQPYMHNGYLATLTEVVAFYNAGGIANENLSPLIKPLGLSTEESQALVAFLQALTGSNVDKLVADGFAAPVGERE